MRRRTRRRSARRPLVYAPIPLGGGRSRRSPWRSRALTIFSLLVLVCAAAAVVAGATNGAPGGGAPAAVRHRPSLRAGAREGGRVVASGVAPPGVAAAGGPASGVPAPGVPAGGPALAVDKLLRSTPIVTGGLPRHRVIALTFDDGPSPYTPKIVAALVRLHAPATFFVVGQQLRYFSAGLRDEIRHGFEVGDHTENHAWLIRLGAAQQYFQIHAVTAQVRRLGAPAPTLFRPPYGAYDARTLSVLRQLHLLGVLWSVDPGDWRRPGAAWITRSILSAARPGAIVEMHDGGGDRSETLAALPAIVNGLRRRHYQLVTVSRLLELDPPARHQRLPHLSAA